MKLPQTFPLTGLSCGSCVAKVTARLKEHPDIAEAEVTLEPPEARLQTSSPLSEAALNDWLAKVDQGKYRVESHAPAGDRPQSPAKNARTYRPLIILLAYLLAVIAAAALAQKQWDWMEAMRLFMGGFFIAFSFFKMLDLSGFADAYRSYDLVAKAVPAYGRVYPFIELGLGLAYLANWEPLLVNGITALVMGISLLGVLKAVFSRETIRCACLGTVFNLPMSTVTIIEDGLMVIMALAALFHLR